MTLLTEFILPLAVVISAVATTTTAALAFQIWRSQEVHNRALFGDEYLENPGLIHMVKAHRRVIKHEHDLQSEELYREP